MLTKTNGIWTLSTLHHPNEFHGVLKRLHIPSKTAQNVYNIVNCIHG